MQTDGTEIVEFLVRQAKEGNREAFSKLVRLFMKRMTALTYRMTQNRESALDLVQETFLTAWEKLHTYRGEAKFENWLYTIASHKTLNYLKKQSQRQENSWDEVSSDSMVPLTDYADPETQLREKEMREEILRFYQLLPDQQRVVFDLRYYKGLSFDEIAQVTGKALGTVKTHYREAVKKLREYAKQQRWRQ